MKRLIKFTFIMVVLLWLGSCKNVVDHHGRTLLVEVGNQYLYREDLQAAIPVGIHGEDSLRFVEEYIRNWVEDALLFQKAEGNIPDNVRIEELVASYRRALVVHTYQEALVSQKVGTEISEEEVEQYYMQNKDLFRATQPYIKGLFMKIPLNAPLLSQVCSWYKKNTQEAVDKLEKYCISNTVSYDYFYNRWLAVSDISVKMPLKELDTDSDYLNRNKNVEVRDATYCYLLHIEDFLPKGAYLPLEFAKSEIKEILINLKRVDFINKMKQDLYQEALDDNDIIYYKNNE